MINDYKVFKANPGDIIENDSTAETWIKSSNDSEEYKMAKSKLKNISGFSHIGCLATVKVLNEHREDDVFYLAFYSGGLNGGGPRNKWKHYLDDIQDIIMSFERAWLVQLYNDCCDDIWYLVVGFRM